MPLQPCNPTNARIVMTPKNNVRREVCFSGQVQGVGFRYTVMGVR